ncbi:hypothetical protein K503DRAFT_774291 [Rhizopogon vinicolor AM-OR11-026]|uniref:Uncharacterized protein n=1 Tax=Rhizopogon vinicolor AM-OR11-026 TaxID=1314800 RepID=A0A1B7MQ50_9AGAM|nr:hypothetical protein K503DRAFT_774291 [Rhizopogon vinicolor AM-OR11-026]
MRATGTGISDLQDHPLRDERISNEGPRVTTKSKLKAGIGKIVASFSRKKEETLDEEYRISAKKISEIETRWDFTRINIATMSLMVIVSRDGGSPPFPFTLQILPTAVVKFKPTSRWRFWPKSFRPKKHHHGWTCDFDSDYLAQHARDLVTLA